MPSIGGTRAFEPSPASTAMVAAALLAAAVVTIGSLGWLGDIIPVSGFRAMTLVVGLLFLLRAIGDFRLVGFFKQANVSAFAYWDTWLYSPLCLAIAVAAVFVAVRDV